MGRREPISAEEFEELLRSASRRIFRVEALPEYNVPADRAIYDEFARGVPLPPINSCAMTQWFESIRKHCERGVRFQRLRLMPKQMTPYLRYEIDWCYTYSNDFGEETRFHQLSPTNQNSLTDFYVVDDSKLIHIEYGAGGTWLGFSFENDSTCTQELIVNSSEFWESATNLEDFLRSYRGRPV